jgi:lipid A 4'-phosphatase
MNDRLLGVPICLWIGFVGFADLMLAFPGIDLAVSGWFYRPDQGFVLRGLWWERIGYYSVRWLMVGVNLGLVGLWLYNRRRARRLLGFTGRRLALLLCLLALVPGLLVNSLLKEHWGRARPVKTIELGGYRQFSPAFVRSDQGGGSFSSGHVAAAAYLVAVAAVLGNGRWAWIALALGYTLFIALIRVGAGGHWLSDALASMFLVGIGWMMLSAWLCGGHWRRC